MTSFKIPAIVMLVTVSLLTGCKTFGTSDATPWGQWRLTTMDGKPLVTTNKQALFTMNLTEDGGASGKVACNNWKAKYEINNNELVVGRAATTRKACFMDDPVLATAQQEFLARLQQASIVKLTDDQLILETPGDKSLLFSR